MATCEGKLTLGLACACGLVLMRGATAADAPPQPASDGSELKMDIDIVAQRLDLARQQILPGLGATEYRFSPEALGAIPQGESAPLNQVLLQAPGVAQDSFGQIGPGKLRGGECEGSPTGPSDHGTYQDHPDDVERPGPGIASQPGFGVERKAQSTQRRG